MFVEGLGEGDHMFLFVELRCPCTVRAQAENNQDRPNPQEKTRKSEAGDNLHKLILSVGMPSLFYRRVKLKIDAPHTKEG